MYNSSILFYNICIRLPLLPTNIPAQPRESYNQKKRMKEKQPYADYKCHQIFGFKNPNEKIQNEDLVSVVKFDQSGSYIALGDKAGRIVIFKALSLNQREQKYQYYTELPAFTRQFDPLNSLQINEEVLAIKWMRPQGNYQKIIGLNGKSIKMWKVFEKPQKKVVKSTGKQLTFPKFQCLQNTPTTTLQTKISKIHEEQLIGFDLSDNEQFILSTDSLRSTLYHLEKPNKPYLVRDLKKNKKIEQIKETINCMKMHPHSDNIFAYGTDRGGLFLSDMRLVSKPTAFKWENQGRKNFFSQMISSYSSISFINQSKYIACRDYMTIKIWDIAKNDQPLACIPIQSALKSKLCEVFEHQAIYDKFALASSNNSANLITGSYNNCFHTVNAIDYENTQYEINYKKNCPTRYVPPGKTLPLPDKMDYSLKTTACDFHPVKNIFTLASLNCFFTFGM